MRFLFWKAPLGLLLQTTCLAVICFGPTACGSWPKISQNRGDPYYGLNHSTAFLPFRYDPHSGMIPYGGRRAKWLPWLLTFPETEPGWVQDLLGHVFCKWGAFSYRRGPTMDGGQTHLPTTRIPTVQLAAQRQDLSGM